MNTEEFSNYQSEFNEISSQGSPVRILGTMNVAGATHAVVQDEGWLYAVPVSRLQQPDRTMPAQPDKSLKEFPAFSNVQWQKNKEAIRQILTEYAHHTTPDINAQLRNMSADMHQGYEGSSQEFQRPKEGPAPSEGLDYDKASGKTRHWK